jgi:hypothetical protein
MSLKGKHAYAGVPIRINLQTSIKPVKILKGTEGYPLEIFCNWRLKNSIPYTICRYTHNVRTKFHIPRYSNKHHTLRVHVCIFLHGVSSKSYEEKIGNCTDRDVATQKVLLGYYVERHTTQDTCVAPHYVIINHTAIHTEFVDSVFLA